ncbi:MAG: oxidoreductase [Actinobacteria bacterium RBG_13_35_12]|nr:MAG: oxidoreductase [Actinobacteria bacterium RBG_13_35_12]
MIKVAQIGVGYWGPNLLRNLVANKECIVKTVIDISPKRLEYVTGLYPSVFVTTNCEDVLNDSEIDAIVIATPVATHFDLAIKALKTGKHILVEKPMAKTVAEVEQIGSVAREKKKVAMVGHTFLYNPAVRFLKKIIDSGELGDVRYIYSQRLNLGRIRTDVDALWNFAPHDVSIIQYFLGDPVPVRVSKQGMDYVQKGIEDVVFMNIVYPNKIMAHIHVSWLDPHRIRRITVVGSKKMVVYDDIADNKIAIYDKGIDRMAVLGEHMDYDSTDFYKFNHRSGDVLLPKINFEEPLKVEIAHFFDCILNGTKCLTGTDHAKKVVDILSRVNK